MSKEFLELSPIIDENKIKVYEDAFKYVLNNKEIKNIAISGIYGSGKSTICNSYFETQKEIDQDKIIYVALGSYDKDESKNNQNNENRIEKQIINQILFQVKSSKIPLSNYQIKETKHSKIILKTIFTSLFTLLVFLWLLFFINNKNYDIDKWQSITFISVMATSTFIFSFILMFLIFRNYQFKFSQIKFNKYLKMEDKNNLNNNETTLDKEMKELVYILKYSGVKVVIFEDLDRFDMIEIFTKLKELNFCLNKAKEEDKNKVKNKDNENIVKFFYLIKDSLFSEPEERTKFFDFIIPVVPYVNSNNSFEKLKELLKQVLGSDEAQGLSNEFLTNISLYINDMRLLKNIINEYKIYLNNIEPKNKDNLFAIILIKNLFPKEYDDLLKDRGIIFKTINEISNKNYSNLNYEHNQNAINETEINHLLPEENYGLIRMLILENYINENYFFYIGYFREGSLSTNDAIYLQNLKENKQNEPLFLFNNVNSIYDRLKDSDYLRFNILNKNLIECTIDKSNHKRILNLFKMIKINPKQKNNFFNITNSLDKKYIETIFSIISDNVELNNYGIINHIDILELIKQDKKFLKSFLIWILSESKSKETMKSFKELIQQNSFILSEFNDDLNRKNIIDSLKLLNVKFSNFKDSNLEKNILKEIEEKKLFELNLENLKYLLINLDENIDFSYEKMISLLYDSEMFLSTKEYLNENWENFLEKYIPEIIEMKLCFNNHERETIKILNSKINNDLKQNYILNNKTVINDISKVNDADLKIMLYKKLKVSFNDNNLESFIKMDNVFPYIYDEYEFFFDWVNNSFSKDENNTFKILKNNKNITNNLYQILNSDELNNNLFIMLFDQSDLKPKDLSINRLEILIEKKKIKFNEENYLFLNEKRYIELLIKWIKIPENKELFFKFINQSKIQMEEISKELFSIELFDYWFDNQTLSDINKTKILCSYFKYQDENEFYKIGIKKLQAQMKKIKDLVEFQKIFSYGAYKYTDNKNECETIIIDCFHMFRLVTFYQDPNNPNNYGWVLNNSKWDKWFK